MGGGGTVIIRQAIQRALTDPLVHGMLSDLDKTMVDPIMGKDCDKWTHHEHEQALKAFVWAAQHC